MRRLGKTPKFKVRMANGKIKKFKSAVVSTRKRGGW